MLIELSGISKIYNEGRENAVYALHEASMQIDRGEFVAILGQSGSGKSTLMNILGCLDIPTYGQYLLDGEAVSEIPPRKLAEIRNRQIGFIFQGFNLINQLTAIENVELPLVYRGLKRSRRMEMCNEALDLVGLGDRKKHLPTELSGGQQQRVAIARAIASNPPIIMADEPTGNLDSRSGSEIMLKLVELNDEGSTVILITHDLHLAKVAKRIITLSDGKIISDEQRNHEERNRVLEELSV